MQPKEKTRLSQQLAMQSVADSSIAGALTSDVETVRDSNIDDV